MPARVVLKDFERSRLEYSSPLFLHTHGAYAGLLQENLKYAPLHIKSERPGHASLRLNGMDRAFAISKQNAKAIRL